MTDPIRPDQVAAKRQEYLPSAVIDAFNELIAKNFDGTSSKFTQNEVVSAILNSLDVDRPTIFARHYLDVEPIYEAVGWDVSFEKNPYATGASEFTFRKRAS